MDSRTGDTYESKGAAIAAGVPETDVVEVRGSRRAVGRVRMACRRAHEQRKARRRMAKAARRGNRR